jgi:hypothetical protein
MLDRVADNINQFCPKHDRHNWLIFGLSTFRPSLSNTRYKNNRKFLHQLC